MAITQVGIISALVIGLNRFNENAFLFKLNNTLMGVAVTVKAFAFSPFDSLFGNEQSAFLYVNASYKTYDSGRIRNNR